MTKTLREQYFAEEILRIGDIVEDSSSGKSLKIIDRGSNYITVVSDEGVTKKWLTEVKIPEEKPEVKEVVKKEFTMTESGQLKLFGYETVGFDSSLTEFIIEQFSEFDDLYSQHQIVKLLDLAIVETNLDRQFELLEKVSSFYKTHNIEEPIIVEGMKSDIERRRIAEILATVAGIAPEKSSYKTVTNAIKALKAKYIKRVQWEVLWPFLKLARSAGIVGVTQNLPFSLDQDKEEDIPQGVIHENLVELLEDNFEELFESLEEEDIVETFTEDELTEEVLSEEYINEVLSMNTRNKLGRQMKARSASLESKRARALVRGASSAVLTARARRLAETLLKRKMFRKTPSEMTRQDKERFEAGAVRRRALVAKLAQRLIGKVRALQNQRMHGKNVVNQTPATKTNGAS